MTIDSPITPFSTVDECEVWIVQLREWLLRSEDKFEQDLIRYEIERAEGFRADIAG